ncbi:MAG: histidine kinase [Chitinophagaceae bacterium]|nr:histidine kinase [Chitinophagaceae bacterium]
MKIAFFYNKYRKHVLFWLSYISFVYLMEIWKDPSNKYLDICFVNLCTIIAFYISFFAYTNIDNGKLVKGLLLILLSIITSWLLRYIYWHYWLPIIGVKPFAEYNFSIFTNIVVRGFIVYSLYALGYFYAQRSIQKQKQLRLAEQQQAEAEKAKLEIENKNLRLQEDFLRAQINPHFLYNCLNFFYTQTFKNHPNVAEGILMLSDIRRYSLKD